MIAVFIHKKYGMEYLLRKMGVHGGGDVCDIPQVAIDEFTQADVIIHCAVSAATADEEFKVGDAEGVLRVNHQKGDSVLRSGSRLEVVLMRPIACQICAGGVIHFPDFADALRIKKRWDGKCAHIHSIPLRALRNEKNRLRVTSDLKPVLF